MAALEKVEDVINIEIREVKLEISRSCRTLFGADQCTKDQIVKNDNHENTDEIDSKRVKSEHNYSVYWTEYDVKNREALEMQARKISSEMDVDSKKLGIEQINEKLNIKHHTDDDSFSSTNAGISLNRIKHEKDNAYNWNEWNGENVQTMEISIEKMNLEMGLRNKSIDIKQINHESIIKDECDCDSLMESIAETLLNRISSEYAEDEESTPSAVTDKSKELVVIIKRMNLELSMDMKSSEDINGAQFHDDVYSSADIKNDILLKRINNKDVEVEESTPSAEIDTTKKLVVRIERMNFKSAVKCKQHHAMWKEANKKWFSCHNCDYSAGHKYNLIDHMKKHSHKYTKRKTTKKSIVSKDFGHCNVTFKSKTNLDNRIIWKHPDFIASVVTSKIPECTHCTYKTTSKSNLKSHMFKRPETSGNLKLRKCKHCNATFKSKRNLDNHIIRKHPDYIASVVTSKIHECSHCTYKTTFENKLDRHMFEHPETSSSLKLRKCKHCSATFKTKTGLDDHTVKKHPDFIESVSTKIHECTLCIYKTSMKSQLYKHMFKHPETRGSYNHSKCLHCNQIFKTNTSLNDHTVRKHPEFIASVVSSKIYECTFCTYKTTLKSSLNRHLLRHPEATSSYKLSKCIHCNAIFKSKAGLDEHIIRKHPDFTTSVSSKLHKCTHCPFNTTWKTNLDRHVLKHSKTAKRGFDFSKCIHCNVTFKTKISFDDHTIQKHPELIASVSSKIHECSFCTYKSTFKCHLDRHMLQHPETASRFKLKKCMHCNATFKTKSYLDDHTIKKHPDFIASVVSSKIHECTHCTYKTTSKGSLEKHLCTHPDATGSYKRSKCIHCNVTFRWKTGLDEHTIRKHPDLVASAVSSKIHECTHCAYKTTIKVNIDKHMLQHPEEATDSFNINKCTHCNKMFISKTRLDEHTIRKHPNFIASVVTSKILECAHCKYKTTKMFNLDKHVTSKHPNFIASVSSKIHECTLCKYKTTLRNSFHKHMLKHPETSSSYKFSKCLHCDATFKGKENLNKHLIRKHPDLQTH